MDGLIGIPQLKKLAWIKTAEEKDTIAEEKNVLLNEDSTKPILKNYSKGVVVFALLFYIIIFVKNTWLGDDAFITLRTVYNFIHGYGLTWNTDERVQTYTHPLWMFLISFVSFFVRVPYIAVLLLCVSVSTLTVFLLALRLVKSPLLASVGILCLAASKAFVDYSTSGLENPLTHLLIVVFALVFYQYRQHKYAVLWLSLLGMLMILNRMDTVLLFLPALAFVFWERRSWRTLRTIALAFVPFLLWELFSLFYYGSLVPNTAYAKLNLGVSHFALIEQGLGYLMSSFNFDPILCVIIGLAIGMLIAFKDWKSLPLLFGMLLYLGYIVSVGGDFMAGRFLTPPYLLAVILLLRNIPPKLNINLMLLLGVALFFGIVTPYTRWSNAPEVIYGSGTSWQENSHFIDDRGITDERYFYASVFSLFRLKRDIPIPDYKWAKMGFEAKTSGQQVVVFPAIGMFGYRAGPNVHVIDSYALGDPLLARLPVSRGWAIGQFIRDLPDGYVETVQTGQNMITDPGVAQYYQYLHFVTSGPLFSWERLVDIWTLNTGGYNYLLQPYIQQHKASNPTPQIPVQREWVFTFSGRKENWKSSITFS